MSNNLPTATGHRFSPLPLIHVCAVVPSKEAGKAARSCRRVSLVRDGAIAALVAPAPAITECAQLALWHEHIVAAALAASCAVVPFRLGITVADEAEAMSLLRLNHARLRTLLNRVRNRVEMGLKVRLAPCRADFPFKLRQALSRIHSLCPLPGDRRERMTPRSEDTIFEGAYLIRRDTVDQYWQACDGFRRLDRKCPILGTGPWAPYSFCEQKMSSGLLAVAPSNE